MKPQTKTYKHVIDLYFESVPHSIRTFSVHGNTLIYIEYEDYLNEHHVTEALRRLLGTSVLLSIKRNWHGFAKGIFCIYLSKMENKVIFAVNFKLNSYG